MSYKWTAYSPRQDITYTFEINPNDGGQPTFAKNITYTSTTAPNSGTLMFEGGPKPQEVTVSGTLLTETQYSMLAFFVTSHYLFQLTDDRGEQQWVYFTSFQPKRVNRAHHPWYSTYSLAYTVVQGS